MANDKVASFLLKPFAKACKEFDLLGEGDRVAVAVSGGKDSRTLLDLLLRYRERVPFSYEVVALHVVGTAAGLPDLTGMLAPWFEERGVAYRFVPLELPPDEPLPMSCFRCSWNRRKALFLAADGLGCNKLAFGHHADDAAVTALLNLLFAGRLETLEPKVDFFGGRITVVRPLIYIPAKELDRYARVVGFPPTPPCPHESDSRRQQVETFLRGFGHHQARIRANIWRATRQA
ncbi:MAG TPA: tRNA 2-thiocytidine biosynthesis protein TtcA [Anaerolineales bacterium]|nr:tRNA 2-thiocytidine biosynthesis protein TtcA [Anaerolineae bacterium]HIQ00998.1 tRNA 2-thiocytidine biosynthesis protein TtcA [Anaerolineales bacterium]